MLYGKYDLIISASMIVCRSTYTHMCTSLCVCVNICTWLPLQGS